MKAVPDEFQRIGPDLIGFFGLSFLLSWSIAIPLALANQGVIPEILPTWTHYLIGYGPMLAALILTGFTRGGAALRDFGRRMLIRQVCLKWWVIALSPLIAGAVLIWILNRWAGLDLRLADLGAVNFLPFLGWGALPLWIMTFGLGEEAGWRGFALPRLQQDRSALAATLILAGVWAVWHLPQFFYLFHPAAALGWLLGLIAGAVVLTWLYNSAVDAIPVTAIWHGSFNFLTASTAAVEPLPAILTILVCVWAIWLLATANPKHLMSL